MSKRDQENRTRSHYEAFPFDFLTEEDERNINSLQPAPFYAFVEKYLTPGQLVAEIGCGPGRGTLFMARRALDVLAVDISEGSLRLAKRRSPKTRFILASNMSLPFLNNTFAAVVSDGVIHHTPDAYQSFSENARILRPGGMMYLAVYRRHRYYYYIYTYLGRPIRWLEKKVWGRRLLHFTLLPLYYFVHLLKSRGKRTWQGAKHFFYDYIITPQATFHTYEEIMGWCKLNDLQLVDYEERVGNVHAFVLKKKIHTVVDQK